MPNAETLSYMFITAHPTDAARILERHPPEETAPFFSGAPPRVSAAVLQAMDTQSAAYCLDRLENHIAASIIDRMPIHIAAVLLRRMEQTEALLDTFPQDRTEDLRLLLRYPDGAAGALMDPRVLTIPDDLTVEEALARVQAQATVVKDYIYVVDRGQILVGVYSLNRLLEALPHQKITALMDKPTAQVSPYMTQQAILEHPGWRLFHDLPVVDPQGMFLGAISYITLRKLEHEALGRAGTMSDQDVSSALGELYWIGLSGFIKGAASITRRRE